MNNYVYHRQGRYVFICVSLLVYLSVCLLTGLLNKLLNKSLLNFMEWLKIIQGPID